MATNNELKILAHYVLNLMRNSKPYSYERVELGKWLREWGGIFGITGSDKDDEDDWDSRRITKSDILKIKAELNP